MTARTTARARATAVCALLGSFLLLVPLAGTAAAHPAAASVPVPIAGLLAAVREEDRDVLRAQLQQRAQNGAGPALGTGLEVTAGQDERRDARRLQAEVPGAVRAGHRELDADSSRIRGGGIAQWLECTPVGYTE